jgi:hypothetical protein
VGMKITHHKIVAITIITSASATASVTYPTGQCRMCIEKI